jgi:1-acyl-sn-glycerol-3-phosphate acyltransferase
MLASMNYCWRLVATGGCFAIFSLGGFVLWLLVFPVVRFVSTRRRSEHIRWIIHKSFGIFLWLMEFVGIMRMEVEGGEKLRNSGGALLLANHPTLIDVVALVSLMPSASCVVKQALWNDPFLGGVVRSAGYLSNSDSNGLIDDCARDLRAGKPLIIFPEGTRTWPGKPLRFQRGAAYTALRSGAQVFPVLIDCQPSTLTRGEKWYQIPPRRFHLRIKVLDPVTVQRWAPREKTKTPTIAARHLTRALEEFFVLELAKWTR